MMVVLSKTRRCPCGAWMAYDKDGPPFWDCVEVLTGARDHDQTHSVRLPFGLRSRELV